MHARDGVANEMAVAMAQNSTAWADGIGGPDSVIKAGGDAPVGTGGINVHGARRRDRLRRPPRCAAFRPWHWNRTRGPLRSPRLAKEMPPKKRISAIPTDPEGEVVDEEYREAKRAMGGGRQAAARQGSLPCNFPGTDSPNRHRPVSRPPRPRP
mmetsp:Transcript_45217/g.96198  ORF Transcript_45217/g.96198 Transcript_45217/m.96198 type:complete len:154 (+) Transcript_45217:716-1177(+)